MQHSFSHTHCDHHCLEDEGLNLSVVGVHLSIWQWILCEWGYQGPDPSTIKRCFHCCASTKRRRTAKRKNNIVTIWPLCSIGYSHLQARRQFSGFCRLLLHYRSGHPATLSLLVRIGISTQLVGMFRPLCRPNHRPSEIRQ